MNIAFLTMEYPSAKTAHSGGIGTSIFNLTKGLLALGHHVSVLVYGQDCDEVFTDNGATIYKIKNQIVKGLSFYFTQKKIQRIINQLVIQNKIDIIEAPDWTGITAFLNLKCPYIIRLNGSDSYFCYLENRKVKFMNYFFEKRGLKRANGLISVSKYTAQITNEIFNLNKDFAIIPNSIDVSNFKSSNNFTQNTILYFGTLIRKKGLLELPLIFNEVYKSNKNAKLILVGKDASDISSGNKSTWQMMITLFDKEAFQNVSYLGAVDYSEIKNQINKATVCVFPTFAEALPVSWLEAIAMQKAVVASDIGWANEIIDDNFDGYLVHPKNHKDYATKTLNLLNNEQERTKFESNARKKIIQKFSIETIANQSVNFYAKIIHNVTV